MKYSISNVKNMRADGTAFGFLLFAFKVRIREADEGLPRSLRVRLAVSTGVLAPPSSHSSEETLFM